MKKHRGRHLLSLLASAALLASLLPAAFAAEAEGEKHITILGTSDMHGNIWGYSYEDNAETDNNGMARLYTYIQQVRAENPNTFLVDAGDDIQGTIMTDDLYNKTPEEPHPVVTAMNYMGYDAMTLGNHEFNWGIPTMQSILGQASFPVLAANVTGAQGEPVTGAGWTIVERGGVKLAVIGVVTPDVPIWDSGKDGIDDAVYEAANVAVGKAIDEIGDQADVIMVSAHMGMYAEFDEEGGSDSAQKILDDNPEIDVLQVAHNHVVVNEKQGSTVIGGVRNGGRDIARFDLTLDADNQIIDSSVEIVDMTGVTPSQELREIPLVAEAHQKTIDYINGGGSLMQDVTSHRSLWFYLFTISWAKRLGNQVMMYGCGIGPIHSPANRRRASRVLQKSVDAITLRDTHSAEELEDMGVTKPQVILSADPTVILPAAPAQVVDGILESQGIDPHGRYIGFALRPWPGFEAKAAVFGAAADYAYETYGLTPVFLPIERRLDVGAAQLAAQHMKAPHYILSQTGRSDHTIGLFARMQAVVSMRLHALVFSAGQGVPLVGVVYDQKISSFLSYIGQDLYTGLDEVTEEALRSHIDAACARIGDEAFLSGGVERLRQVERRNSETARMLLER